MDWDSGWISTHWLRADWQKMWYSTVRSWTFIVNQKFLVKLTPTVPNFFQGKKMWLLILFLSKNLFLLNYNLLLWTYAVGGHTLSIFSLFRKINKIKFLNDRINEDLMNKAVTQFFFIHTHSQCGISVSNRVIRSLQNNGFRRRRC